MDVIDEQEESKSDIENNKNKMNQSSISNVSSNKSTVMDKSQNPTLIDLMGDDMSHNAQTVIDRVYRSNLEEQLKKDRMQADQARAEERLKEETILKKDGSQYHFFKSSIESVCNGQDIHLFDYMYFLKKFSFIMILLFWMYITNFGSNTSGEYLTSNDEITGFEEFSIANINGLETMARFEIEKQNGMDQVESSKFLTCSIDVLACCIFLGIITLRARMRIFARDYTVKLANISTDYNGDLEKEIKKVFDNKFGKVHEVAIIKDTGDILKNQIKLSKISRKVGDLKARNLILGVEGSSKLTKFTNMEEKQKAKLERLVLNSSTAAIKEVYVTFELPEHKKKWIEDTIEIGEFITKVRGPSKKRFIVHKGLDNPNQKIYENASYPNVWKIIKLLIITSFFTGTWAVLVGLLSSEINSNYKYLKNHMQWMAYEADDYTSTQLATSSEEILTCVWFLKGDSVNSDAEMKKLCSKYQDTKSETISLSIIMGILLTLLNLAVKHGYNSFKNIYRFGSLRTRNWVLFFQIYLSIVILNLIVPLVVFADQFKEPTRDYYLAISPMYSLWIIFTVGLLPLEKFSYWLWVILKRKMTRKSWIIQRELEENMRRKELGYHHKIPYLLGILTVVMYLVPGLPFLLMVFSIFVLIYFWVEKLLILKFYRKPKNLDGTPLEIVDYMVVLILLLHIFSCISTFGTTDIFPEDTKRVQGTRKGFSTSYYEPSEKGFLEKLGVIINIPYVIMLSLILLFLVLCFLCRNKIWWRKFKFFSMSFRYKYKYIPSTFSKAKNLVIIGETSYNMADIERYRQVFATFDLSNINDDSFKSSYSQLFQTSNGPVDTLSKLNLHSSPDKINDSFNKSNLSGLSAMNDPQKMVDNLKNRDLMIRKDRKPKDPKVQVVKEGKKFDRKKTFIKNWEFDEENKNDQGAEVSGSFGKSENEEEKAAKSMNTMADKILNLKKQLHVNAVFKRSEDY